MKTSQKIICFILLLQGVWCRDFSISLPEKIEALNGLCVTINCTFDIESTYDKDLTDTAGGMWYKDGHNSENIVFNSSNSNSSFNGKITGTLKDKNCTTVFYNVNSNHKGIFFFRIKGNNGLKWTYTKRSASIHVIESPPRPTVKMLREQMEVQEVLEGNAVRLSCSSITLCSSSPPTLTWSSTNSLPLNENNRLQQQQSQTEIISDLNFTATYLQHGVTFTCTLTYQLQNRNTTAQSNIMLHVLYAPKNTSVSVFPSNSVLEGTSVTLTCRSDANPAVLNYTWYRENGGQQIQTGQNLTFNVTDRTHAGRYYCQTRNQHGSQNTSVLLNIQYASGFNLFLVLIGVAVGVSVIVILCAIICFCKRRGNRKPAQNRQEQTTRSITTNEENNGESVYVNKDILSSAGADTPNQPETFLYSSIDFTKNKTESEESRRVSSPETEYAIVKYSSAGGAQCSTDVSADVLTKQVKSKISDEADTELYAQVKRRNP